MEVQRKVCFPCGVPSSVSRTVKSSSFHVFTPSRTSFGEENIAAFDVAREQRDVPVACATANVEKVVGAHGTKDRFIVLWATATLKKSHLRRLTSRSSSCGSFRLADKETAVESNHTGAFGIRLLLPSKAPRTRLRPRRAGNYYYYSY